MLELTGNVKLRYFSALDRFLRIRAFGPEEIAQLVSGINFRDRRSYVQFVINTMVVDWSDKLLGELIAGPHSARDLAEREEQLFALCVDVNPALDIDAVAKYMTAPEPPAPLVFLDGKRSGGADMGVSREKLLGLEVELEKRIVGQDEAVRLVVDAVRKAYVGFRDERKPVGNFLFVGPTGVGKTELAKTLARSLFSESDGLVRIDCSEYAEAHEYAKLIGSPPGYIGHGEGGQLTEALRKRPDVVVLFDEIEKANERLHHVLLQILDDGLLTDGKGVRVSFRNAIVVLTSNVGTREMEALSHLMGFHEEGVDERQLKSTSKRALDRVFRPEFMNRLDEVILFKSFSDAEARRVVEVMLEEVCRRVRDRGITLVLADDVTAFLVTRGIDRRYGARPLQRAITRYVEVPLANYVLARGIEGGTVEARVEESADRLVFN